jgi:hypothetical protein
MLKLKISMKKNKISTFWVLFYIVTSIGTITHEISHAAACYLTKPKTKINKVVIFQIPKDNTDRLGYVDHDPVNGYMNNFLVNISPFFVGTFLSVGSYCLVLVESNSYLFYLFLWLGFSFGLFALPSRNEFWKFNKYSLDVFNIYIVAIKHRLCFSRKEDLLTLLSLVITVPIICFIELIYKIDKRYRYAEVIYSFFLFLIAFVIVQCLFRF